jgi:CubicO group peptidase (beta-lactamase class C family)
MKHTTLVGLFMVLALVLSLTGCKQTISNVSEIPSINDVLKPILAKYGLPAMAAVVISDGKIIAEGAVGVRKWGDKTPVTIDDKFHLGSCGKAMTATLMAILVEQGKLSWTTTLEEIFPELKDEMLPKYKDVTLLHLLSHHAGLPSDPSDISYLPGIISWDLTKPVTQQRYEGTKIFLCQPPGPEVNAFPEPGTTFLYSNFGYILAGAVAEHITGKSWEELITTLLFEPLGLTTAGFGAMGTDSKVDQPWPHQYANGMIIPISPDSPNSDNPPLIGPAGRIHMSIRDWAKFIVMHLEGEKGGSQLLNAETFKVLHTQTFNTGAYALGWFIEYSFWTDGKIFTHAGYNDLNYARVWMSTERDFAVLITTNIDSPGARTACSEAINTLIEKFLPEE